MPVKPVEINAKNMSDETSYKDHIEVSLNTYNQIHVISNIDDFFSMREQWNEINDQSQNGNIFVSWEWLYTWWETYQNQSSRSLYILKCTNSDNELLGIAPFQIVNNPKKYFPCSRQLILLGTGETDGSHVFGEYMDLIIKPGYETIFLSELSTYLEQHKNLWDGLRFHQQLSGSHLKKLFDLDSIESTDSALIRLLANQSIVSKITENGFRTYIDLPKTYKSYLMGLQKKMRNNITRTYTRLKSEQSFSIDLVTTESEINAEIAGEPSAIKLLSNLNRTRSGEMNRNSVFSQSNFELFHSRLLKRLLPLNKVRLRILRFGKEPVAALYSFIDGDTVHAYQSGFETDYGHRYSLLTTLLTQEISSSIENSNITRFNFMYSERELTYKKRYSGTTEKMYDVTYNNIGIKYKVFSFLHGPLKTVIAKRLKF